jgi:hypothetical protein
VILALAIAPQLPDRPLVQATIQTMTAKVGYPKSLLEALALPVLALVPLQVVCALEAELCRGRAEHVYRTLTSVHQTLSIPGLIVVRPGAASIVFATVTIWWMQANARLIESLHSGPYYSLFLELGVVRGGQRIADALCRSPLVHLALERSAAGRAGAAPAYVRHRAITRLTPPAIRVMTGSGTCFSTRLRMLTTSGA